jgi:2-succinyl-5-enolpyruvyl-6-hydroxy-3-cyclohexene-1-carboxylate synthase
VAADPFRSLTGTLRMSPEGFFRAATQRGWQKPHEYLLHWQKIDRKTSTGIQQFFENPMPFNEFQAVQTLFRFLKPGAVIHAANSMPVRYLNFLSPQGFQVFANRGTSGIDGSTSTAVGHALANPTQLHILLTGDVAFFYDRNGLWRANLPENLWIVVFNNAGGGIFNMIDGPSALPELSPFFIGQQPFTAETTAREAGFTYQSVHNEGELHETLSRLSTTLPNKKLLEVFTNHEDNKTVFLHFKKSIVQLFQRETKTKTS